MNSGEPSQRFSSLIFLIIIAAAARGLCHSNIILCTCLNSCIRVNLHQSGRHAVLGTVSANML